MSVFICSTKYGGCGYIGDAWEWEDAYGDGLWMMCPQCFEDHAFFLTEDNISSLTNQKNLAKAKELLVKEISGEKGDVIPDEGRNFGGRVYS